jgi:hypothetical protein
VRCAKLKALPGRVLPPPIQCLLVGRFLVEGILHMHSQTVRQTSSNSLHYFLYLMGSMSLGPYPPRFAGLSFNTTGDMRRWGLSTGGRTRMPHYSNL